MILLFGRTVLPQYVLFSGTVPLACMLLGGTACKHIMLGVLTLMSSVVIFSPDRDSRPTRCYKKLLGTDNFRVDCS